jgi:prepilin-type N-terminal cleavage/methylation domain-containing protein
MKSGFQPPADRRSSEAGFTLIELLVVVLIVAVLAAIAIPVFLRQGEKAKVADVQALVRNAATAVESYAATNGGSYVGVLASDDWAEVRIDSDQTADVPTATELSYCVEVTDTRLVVGSEWRSAHLSSTMGKPQPGLCL